MKKKKEEIVEPSFELAYEYWEKFKEEERHVNFDKAIELATLAAEMFNKLSSDNNGNLSFHYASLSII